MTTHSVMLSDSKSCKKAWPPVSRECTGTWGLISVSTLAGLHLHLGMKTQRLIEDTMNLLGASMSPDQAIKQETRNDRHTSFGFSCQSCHSRTEASQQDGAPVASSPTPLPGFLKQHCGAGRGVTCL